MRLISVSGWIKVVSRLAAGLAVVSLMACGGGGGSTASAGGGGSDTVTSSSITLPTSVEVVSAK